MFTGIKLKNDGSQHYKKIIEIIGDRPQLNLINGTDSIGLLIE